MINILRLVLSFIIFTPLCFGAKGRFSEYKSKIDHLENTMIQDFNIDLPSDESKRYSRDYTKAATQLEVKFEIQRKLFYKIEEKYFHLGDQVSKDLKQNLLTKEEASRLKTSIEYATRIILRSRKLEILENYKALKKSLTHNPKLKEIYAQLNDLEFKNCSLENIKLNQKYSQLSFDIKQKNKFGSWTSSQFTITNEDIKSGRLTSKPAVNSSRSFPFQSYITQFWTTPQKKNQQKFLLHVDPDGEIVEGEFKQDYKEPLIELWGLKLGSQEISKTFDCNKKRQPASVSVKTD